MPLRVDNTEITQVFVDGKECKTLYFNGTPYFGKKYTLSGNFPLGMNWTANRLKSPNQHASSGQIYIGSAIYEGDEIEISVSAANSNYINPKLYADINDGESEKLRDNTFKFTVVGNVDLRGTVEPLVLYGNQTFSGPGNFTLFLLTPDMDITVSAQATFKEEVVDYSGTTTNTVYRSVSHCDVPAYIYDNYAYVRIYRDGKQVYIEFNAYDNVYKGCGTRITPTQLKIIEIRRKV